jgi:putative membrane protein
VVFLRRWFVGLFYLPRIFVNLAMVPSRQSANVVDGASQFTQYLALPALGLGCGSGWATASVAVQVMLDARPSWPVVLAIAYHHVCSRMPHIHKRPKHSHVWWRWFTEAAEALLVAAVVLVVKPF